MERRKFTREFKLEAVRLIKDRGVSYVQASQDLGVHPSQLRDWVKHGRPPRMVYRLKHRDVIDADLNSIREVASLAIGNLEAANDCSRSFIGSPVVLGTVNVQIAS
jgi:transposase-like protein